MTGRYIAGATALAMATLTTFADVIHVPGDYATIQEAIDAAAGGDEIIVAEGTYVEHIDFLGKDIIVRSTDPTDPEIVAGTIIDGSQNGTVVTMTAGVIRGFTIRNGLADFAGGVYARDSAEIRDNVLTGNDAVHSGGAIYADGDVVIANNVITDNAAVNNSGAGVYARTRAVITGNLISVNVADVAGGGINVAHNCIVRNNVIVGNRANYGGGIDGQDNAAIRSNLIAGNWVYHDGGGVYGGVHWGGHNGAITSNTILGNIALDTGSGIYADRGVVSSNIVAFSVSDRVAVGADPSAYVDYNCVFGNVGDPGSSGPHDIEADPEFVPGAGGVWTADPTYDPETFTTTLTDSMAEFAPGELLGGLVNPDTTLDFRFAIVANTQTTITVMGNASPFVQAGDGYQVYDFHLVSSSPCISAGDPTRCVDFYSGSDMDGEPRVQDCNIDIGADEFPGLRTVVLSISSTMTTPTIEVSQADCNGLSDGIGSFNRFYDTMHVVELDAEELADIPFRWILNGEQQPEGQYSVLVLTIDHVSAVAEYSPVVNITQGTYFTTIQDAISSFSTVDGDEIVAGANVYVENVDFLDKDITLRSVNPTDPDVVAATVIDGNNEDTVVTLSAGTLSGFTICNGSGGGVDASGAAVVSDNIIEGNHASSSGAGVWAQDNVVVRNNIIRGNTDCQCGTGIAARGDVLITGNTITLNVSDDISDQGGGAYLREHVLFTDNTVVENRSGQGGGVLATDDSVVWNNIISNNVGLNRAGGVYARGNSLIANNVVSGNESHDVENGGAGVYAYGTPLVTNNAIIDNTSFGPGGGVQLSFGADLLGNTIVANSADTVGGGVYVHTLHEQFILLHNIIAFNTGDYGLYADEPIENDYNCVFGNELGDYGGLAAPGWNDINADPLLDGDNLHLLVDSPCIDAGDPAFAGGADETDIDGDPRLIAGRVDIGADEFRIPGDLDGDGDVDLSDLAQLLTNYGTTSGASYEDGDLDGDGDVDLSDLAQLLTNYGTTHQ